MRERLIVSVFIAVLLHFILLLVLQLLLKFERSRIPEYSGPLYVTLGETPDVVPAAEKTPEPRQSPRPQRQQPRAEQSPGQSGPQQGGVAAGVPRPRSAPSETEQPEARPRTGLRFLEEPQREPASDERYLPPEPNALQNPPAQRQSRRPAPAQQTPAPQDTEVRPQEQPEGSPLLDLRSLDSSLAQPGGAAEASGGSRSGSSSQQGSAGQSGSAQEGREGIVIEWTNPSFGRNPTQTPRPAIPAWVSRQGVRLTVVVSFVLTPQGVLQDVKVEQSSGYSDVDSAVQDALRRWKFPSISTSDYVTGRIPYTIIPQ
jgi:TonB family protein